MRTFTKRPTIEEALIFGFDYTPKDELISHLRLIDDVAKLDSAALEVLEQCALNGPIEDGDLVSKSGRDQCLDVGALAQIVVKGEDGFQACTYRGWSMLAVAYCLRMRRLPETAPAKQAAE